MKTRKILKVFRQVIFCLAIMFFVLPIFIGNHVLFYSLGVVNIVAMVIVGKIEIKIGDREHAREVEDLNRQIKEAETQMQQILDSRRN